MHTLTTNSILLIDDERNMLDMLSAILGKKGYTIDTAENGRQGLELLEENSFDFILCDLKMPVMDGLQFLEEVRIRKIEATIIMMSAFATVDIAVKAMKRGAYDFISKPFRTDEVLLILKKAEERELLKKENNRLQQEMNIIRQGEGFASMVGSCEPMQELFKLAGKIAQYDTTVLITGESGTGKELLAKGIHLSSPRSKNTFSAINCASIPEHLLESELFGYVKGAFTGADRDKKGIFEEAGGSTLFLDEIGELPLSMQVKLLRTLQEGEVRPVGSNRQVQIDVRILAATSRDLREAVKSGRFREDLFYRLNVMHLHIPPLRERQNDIHSLCMHLIKKMNIKLVRQVEDVSSPVLTALMQHAWPGNVRELENVIERAVVLTNRTVLELDDLPESVRNYCQNTAAFDECRDDLSLKKARRTLEALMIKKALDATNGNKSRAGELLELSYPSLLNKIKKYNLG